MDIKIIEVKKSGRTLCKINGRKYNLPNGLLKVLQNDSIPIKPPVKHEIAEIDRLIERSKNLLASIENSPFRDIEAENMYRGKINILNELRGNLTR